MPFSIHRTCCAMPVGSSSPTMATTRGPCSTTSGTRTSSTRSDTPKWRQTGSRTLGLGILVPPLPGAGKLTHLRNRFRTVTLEVGSEREQEVLVERSTCSLQGPARVSSAINLFLWLHHDPVRRPGRSRSQDDRLVNAARHLLFDRIILKPYCDLSYAERLREASYRPLSGSNRPISEYRHDFFRERAGHLGWCPTNAPAPPATPERTSLCRSAGEASPGERTHTVGAVTGRTADQERHSKGTESVPRWPSSSALVRVMHGW